MSRASDLTENSTLLFYKHPVLHFSTSLSAGESGAPDIIRNPADVYQLYINLVNSAGSEITLLLPPPAQDRADVLRSTLQSLEYGARRGVQVRVLTPASTKLTCSPSMPPR